jgi:hypothetical protein
MDKFKNKFIFVEILNYTIMKDLLNNLNELMAGFSKDAAAQVENGNKAAGARARKASLTIEKALKEFRKISIEDSKK